jgi:hypothetical protein
MDLEDRYFKKYGYKSNKYFLDCKTSLFTSDFILQFINAELLKNGLNVTDNYIKSVLIIGAGCGYLLDQMPNDIFSLGVENSKWCKETCLPEFRPRILWTEFDNVLSCFQPESFDCIIIDSFNYSKKETMNLLQHSVELASLCTVLRFYNKQSWWESSVEELDFDITSFAKIKSNKTINLFLGFI